MSDARAGKWRRQARPIIRAVLATASVHVTRERREQEDPRQGKPFEDVS